jgi:thioredoxin reductase (NADPH)
LPRDVVVLTVHLSSYPRALALEPGKDRHLVRLEGDHEISARAVVLATGAEYRRLPVANLQAFEGVSVFYAAGPPEAQRCSDAGILGTTRCGIRAPLLSATVGPPNWKETT